MLRRIQLARFKCFHELNLPVKPLTLLTGLNASGKSTVIQALLLLHQTAIDSTFGPALLLDGSMVSLGTLGDVVNRLHGRRQFAIALGVEHFGAAWTFESEDKRDIAVPVARCTLVEGAEVIEPPSPTHLLSPEHRSKGAGAILGRLLERMSYVSAERVGPRETYPLATPGRHRSVGPEGELAPGLVYWHGDMHEVLPGLRLPEETAPYLSKQVNAWLDHFFPGAGFEVQPVRGANLVTLGLRTSPASEFYRPQNVGFGLSHIFPILVAVLHAGAGDLVIVENPEVHLHPQGQARMGQFFARAAAAGVQLLVETHSDHVLNGVRRAVRDEVVAPEAVAIHFFQPPEQAERTRQSQIVSPLLDRHGNIDHWPDGFFDQFEKDLGYLAGL